MPIRLRKGGPRLGQREQSRCNFRDLFVFIFESNPRLREGESDEDENQGASPKLFPTIPQRTGTNPKSKNQTIARQKSINTGQCRNTIGTTTNTGHSQKYPTSNIHTEVWKELDTTFT